MDSKTAAELLDKMTEGFRSPAVKEQMQDVNRRFSLAREELTKAAQAALANFDASIEKLRDSLNKK